MKKALCLFICAVLMPLCLAEAEIPDYAFLFWPEEFPKVSIDEIKELAGCSYRERAKFVLNKFQFPTLEYLSLHHAFQLQTAYRLL